MSHRSERRIATTKAVREIEAEAVAFLVGTTLGLSNGQASRLNSPLQRQLRFPRRELGSDPAHRRRHPHRTRK